MTGIRAIVLGVVLLQAQTVAADCTPAEFQKWYHAAVQGTLDVPRAVVEGARRFRYVFVAGFTNERRPGYFAQPIRELKAHGVPSESIHVVFPSARASIEENRDEVRSRFLEIASRGPERLVIIAHSRGANDTLAFALEHAPFVRDHVQALFLVQGAFGGTRLADYLLGEGVLMDRRLPFRVRVLASLASAFETFLMKRGRYEGLTGLTRRESGSFWNRMVKEHADAVPVVGPKTFYITSQVQPSRLRLFRRAIASYLQTYYGSNDGIVLLRDQSLPGLGTRLCVLDAGHADLTHRFPAARTPRRLRRALIQSILMAVGRTGDDPDVIPVTLHHRPRRRAG